jgi:NADH-quinone oxidoreductase subunit J
MNRPAAFTKARIFAELRQGFQDYLPVGGLIGAVFLVELLLVVGSWAIDPGLVQ